VGNLRQRLLQHLLNIWLLQVVAVVVVRQTQLTVAAVVLVDI